MIVLDASVLIAHLDRHDAHHEAASECLVEHAELPFGSSSISLAEVLVGPVRAGRLQPAQEALQALGIAELPLTAGGAQRLAALRTETKLKLPDCCVLLAAQDVHGRVLTFDRRLAAEAERLGVAC
jgi:predicted nucleic acid-binding protein